jgi:hypothetical protein
MLPRVELRAAVDTGDWLRNLGLEQDEPAFRDYEIDDRVLRGSAAEDWKDLGISVVGHRRRLPDAMGELWAAKAIPRPRCGEDNPAGGRKIDA